MKSEKHKDFIRHANKPIAIVFGLGAPNSLGIIRTLGRRGIPVIGLDPKARQPGFFSKYCQAVVCPDPIKREEEFITLLVAMGEMMSAKGVMIQPGEELMPIIMKDKSELEKYYEMPWANLNICEILANKEIFYKTLEKLNMPCPKTYFPTDVPEVIDISKEIMYPCIVKPVFSGKFAEEFHVKCFKANSGEELAKAYGKAISSGHKVMIQEIIPGSDANMHLVGAYFDQESKPLGTFTFRRIRQYPRGFGNGALCISVLVPEIAELCTSLLKKINYHGIIDAELKLDPRDGRFKFIEINPRAGWQNSLCARCGIELPYIAYMDALGNDVEKAALQKEGVKWLYMFNDLRSSFQSMLKGELSPIKWIKSLRGEREYAIFARDDPLPFFSFLCGLGLAVPGHLWRQLVSFARLVVRR